MTRSCALATVLVLASCGSTSESENADAAVVSGPKLTAGIDATCSIRSGGGVRCWGSNASGRLGHGGEEPLGDDEAPSTAGDIPVAGDTVGVVTGSSHTCALDSAGQVRCWGSNMFGQLGTGSPEPITDPSAAPVLDVGGQVAQLAASAQSTCARLLSGDVRCWGTNATGLLGTGDPSVIIGDNEPASAGEMVPLGEAALEIHSAVFEVCARLVSGSIQCWGRRFDDEVFGDDEPASDAPPVDLGGAAVVVRTGVADACAILSGGRLRCWGENAYGRLGYGGVQPVMDPADAGDVPIDGAVVDVALGRQHTCVLLDDGSVRCWGVGAPSSGVPGSVEVQSAADAIMVDVGGTVVELVANRFHTCGLLDDGGVRCWGEGTAGALGYGSTEPIGDDETPAMAGDVPVD